MRTTVTLDADVADRLRALAHERGLAVARIVNSMLRTELERQQEPEARFQVAARDLRLRPGIDLTRALDLAARLEDEETISRLRERRATR